MLRASGGFDDDAPPPTLPYYLDRLPAKPPSLIFEETYGGPTEATKPTDFRAALLIRWPTIARRTNLPPRSLAVVDRKTPRRRRDLTPTNAAALCNLLEDVRDLFAAVPPVPGKASARYIRWRVDHADAFHLAWDARPSSPPTPVTTFNDQNP